jgi:hypothetical protein
MPKLPSLARASLVSLALLSVPPSALAADTLTVDQTIPQTCELTSPAVGVGVVKTVQVPIRLQFSVPESLGRGDLLHLDQQRVSLPDLAALKAAVRGWLPDPTGPVRIDASGATYGGGARITVTGMDSNIFAPAIDRKSVV